MKITPNPLVASFTGSAGAATAAIWHGRNYLRKKVVPSNPQTTKQTNVRDSMKRLVQVWQSWAACAEYAPCKAALTFAALPYTLPAYNLFTKLNRALEQAASELVLMPDVKWTAPYGGPVGMVSSFAAAAGVAGAIDLTWVKLHDAGYSLLVYVREVDTNILKVAGDVSFAEAAQAGTITGMSAGISHQVYGLLHRTADTRVGQSVVDTSLSGA